MKIKVIGFGFLLVLFVMHYPFLDADPDTQVSLHTRGAWTDEGLYTSQIRNLVNHGYFDMKENSTFVRGPFLNIMQLPFFYVFGPSLLVSRLITLLFTLFVLSLFIWKKKLSLLGILLTGIVFTQYHVFQFSHYGLAEIICIDFILLSLFSLFRFSETKGKQKKETLWIFLSALFLFLSYAAKIQFLYAAIILPFAVFIDTIVHIIQQRKISYKLLTPFFWSLLFTIGFALFYFLAWYLPNKEFYSYIMSSETSNRYPEIKAIWEVARFNYRNLLFVKGLKLHIILFYSCIFIFITLILIRKLDKYLHIPLIFGFVWILIELHKVPMVYLPTRYFLSLIVASGLFITTILVGLSQLHRITRYLIFSVMLVLLISNSVLNYHAYQRQSWDIKYANDYLSRYNFDKQPVIGPWASSLTWKTKAITFPVWNHYFNYKDPVSNYNPRIIVSEDDESESDHTYESQGIDLDLISDSSRTFNIWRYKVSVYWIKD